MLVLLRSRYNRLLFFPVVALPRKYSMSGVEVYVSVEQQIVITVFGAKIW